MRHRILGALGAAGPADHIFNLRNLAQDVLDPVVQPIDFVERGFRRKDGLQQEGTLVQLRHEVAADSQSRQHDRDGNEQRRTSDHDGVTQAPVQDRCVPLLHLTEHGHVLVGSIARGLHRHGGDDGHERQREDERRRHRRDDRRGQGLVHAPLDAGHAKQRQEDHDDNHRRKADRPRNLGRRMERRS
jgi:hypothetical protein